MHERENRILSFWKKNDIFQKSLDKPSPKGNFVFYDGPPYATGLPHYGHVLPTTVKDIIPRYKTMQGFHVPRRWGWDCHGLPIENLIEKEMGLKSKREIEELGVEKFNTAARNSVLRYADQWKEIIPRLGRWIDMDNDYRTMDASYMESVMWSFCDLNKKGFVYEGYKVMPFCPHCGTSLSNFEVAQGYKDITDISAFVKFEIIGEPKTYALAWTTTPWTLPGNVALAVNPELSYTKVELNGESFWVASGLVEKVFGENAKDLSAVEVVKGAALVGKSYKPVFPYYANEGTLPGDHEARRANAWKIYAADFVTAEDGTGIVHIAPAYGEDDMTLSRTHDLPIIHHVNAEGLFVSEIKEFAGQSAKPKDDHQKGDIEIIKYLAHPQEGRADYTALFKKEKYIHSYPHCWRCNTPLLNLATSSWFIKVTALKEKLIEENNKTQWTPHEIGDGRFGKWLEGARDWAVSRSRYWGSPLPVWRGEKSGKTEFVGSVLELKEKLRPAGNANSIVLMRHGEAESNLTDVISSQKLDEYGLTDLGRTQVKEGAERLKEGDPVTIIYCSDLRRTRETAETVATEIGYDKTKIVFDARLRELNGGDFDGQNWAVRGAYFKDMNERIFKRVPNGESVEDVKRRVNEFLYDIDTRHKGERILVVTHGLPVRLAMHTAAGKTTRDLVRAGWTDISDPNASLHECDFVPLPHNEMFELDLHRPYIDAVTWQNTDGEIMRRVPEVFDVWYDSGSMSFAQNHYPFDNEEVLLAKNSPLFPADFIAEGLDQTRGWFYSLLVLSAGLFDRSAYKRVIVNGLILGEDGRKMSKSLKNYPDLMPTVERYGADALRYFLVSSPAVRGEEVAFTEKGLDDVNKKLFNRLENVFTFYDTYAEKGNDSKVGEHYVLSAHVLDQWIIARTYGLIAEVTKHLEGFELDRASRPIADFIDDLSTWYLRRSRERFKGDDKADKECALNTTRYVLDKLAHVMAPFTPFIAEDLYQKVRSANFAESVHLEAWPKIHPVDTELLTDMAALRKIVESGLALRAKSGIKVRQPLASFTYDKSVSLLSVELETILADELNVKAVIPGTECALDTNITDELKAEGQVRELIRGIQELRKTTGLTPSDIITIHVDADETARRTIDTHKHMLMRAVQAELLEYALIEQGNKIEADGISVTILIGKV